MLLQVCGSGVSAQFSSFESLEGRTLFSSPTDLDSSFSGDGKVITDFGGANDVAHAVAVQSDGKIVVAGETQVTVGGVKKTAFAAVRFNKDGSLDDGGSKDTTKGDKFGTGGKFARVLDQGGGTGALAVAIQKDGKIILGGNAIKSTTSGSQWYFLRLNKDGSADSGFGTSGVQVVEYTPGLNPQFNAMVLQPSGKLVIAGGLQRNWVIRRLTTSGKIDKTFAGDGFAEIDFGSSDVATAIALDNRGGIVLAGNSGNDVGVARLFSEGDPDGSFGNGGKNLYLSGFLSAEVGAVAPLPNGNIHIAFAGQQDATAVTATVPVGGTVVYDNSGKFLGGGFSGGRTGATGLANGATDFLVIGGTTVKGSAPESFYLDEIRGIPSRVTGFGSNTDHNVATALAIAPDGKIVQVGSTTAGGGGKNFAIARYIGTPTANLGSLNGKVFFDADQDGVQDPNDGLFIAERVFIDADNNGLFDPNTERSMLTDNSGNYKFPVAPGTYHVRHLLRTPYFRTLPQSASGDYFVNVASKQSVGGINFGTSIQTTPNPSTRIVGSVYFDFNGNDFRDVSNPTEPDLPGRTVFLDLNDNAVLDANEPRSITDGGGNFKFENLTPGLYKVGDILPAGWTHTNPNGKFYIFNIGANQTREAFFGTGFADDDDTITEANSKPGNQINVGGSVNFSIGNVTDVDMIRFTAKKGQRVGFDLDRATGSKLNSFLRIFDANGNQLASNDDAAAPGESKGSDSYLKFTFNAAGTYFVGVSNNANKAYEPRFGYDDNGVGTTGAYKLSLVNVTTSAARPAAKTVASIFADVSVRDEGLAPVI